MGINRENGGRYQTRGESEKRNKQGKSNQLGREINISPVCTLGGTDREKIPIN